ncbi:hypothetical protein EB796_008776 [Bugula neritina]|uniref:Uncharacterized protein n=1 Tax=Bugula neritina TaxID=10212 RepID=A0A7J7K4N9_BUGNE|nr:hypothetical protein EB796_008776 [Bugula neritina]
MEFFFTSNGQSESHGQEFNMFFSGGSPIRNTSYGESQSNERDSHSVYTAAAELNKSTDYGLPSLAAFSAFSFQDDPKPIDQTQFSSMLDHLNQNELDLNQNESAPYYPAPKTSSPFSESLDSTSSQSTPDSLSQSVLYLENQLQHAKNPSTNVPSTTYSYMNMTPSESLYSQSTTLGQAWAQTFAQTWPQEQSQTWTHPLSHQPQTHSYSSPPTYTSGNSSTWSAQGGDLACRFSRKLFPRLISGNTITILPRPGFIR